MGETDFLLRVVKKTWRGFVYIYIQTPGCFSNSIDYPVIFTDKPFTE